MRVKIFSAVVLLLLATASTSCHRNYETVGGDSLHTRIYTLPNGLKVYLSKNADKPEIQTMIAVRAGSVNDPVGSTGLAHYMEHIMFKGTSRYGTSDYAAEKVYLDQIDSLYEVYGQASDETVRKAIYRRIDSVSYLSSKIAIANEFDKLAKSIGASNINAFTSTEKTCYHEVIPASELDRWAAIESGRFRDLVIRGFHTELETVYEEFNLYSTRDNSKCFRAINNILYPTVPYRQHEIIGTQADLQNPSLVNMKRFWHTYYRPNNVAICLAGDLDYDEAMAVITKYFGDWEPNDSLPVTPSYEAPTLSTPRDTIVLGLEAPQLWLAWRSPRIADPDAEVMELIGSLLNNGKCGLMDINVAQQQRVLDCYAGADANGDFGTFYVYGTAKEGQSLDSVRAILLAEVERLKAGDFSDEMLRGIMANSRRYQMESEQSNMNRCRTMMSSFIYGIAWEDMVHRLDRQAKITKEEIVRVANRYLTDGYAAIYKKQEKDNSLREIAKPTISPIEMNRGINSAYADSLMALETPPLKPQFLDIEKDLTIGEYQGREWLYRRNKDNELFRLSIISNGGLLENLALAIAGDYMSYLGTENRSLEQLQAELYQLAGDMSVWVGNDIVQLDISGLQENMPGILALLEDHVLRSVADSAVYERLVADAIRQHNDYKTNQQACFSMLTQYGTYGKEFALRSTLTPETMRMFSPEQLTSAVRDKALASAKVVYYGPASETEVRKILNGSDLMQGTPDTTAGEHEYTERVERPEVLVAPYDAPNFYLRAMADWGEVYSPEQEAMIRLFNQYFGGSMSAIVFQELREARSLAYNAYALYDTPYFADGDNYFFTGIVSQTDKLQDCVEAFAQICNHMPVVESTFEQAKKAVLLQIERKRYTRNQPLWTYIRFQDQGWDHDWNEDVYREVQRLTLDDLVAFQQEHVANRTYRYMILGNPRKLDMEYLKTLGDVEMLSIDDIFVY